MKKDDVEVIVIKEEDIEVVPSSSLRSTKFTSESFKDNSIMVYEKSNSFALAYYGISRSEQSLLCAGLVAAYNVNKLEPYDEFAISHGIQVSVPIKHVARLMGYDTDDPNKSFYKTIKASAAKLTKNGSAMKENANRTSFSAYSLISQVDYNKDNDGRVKFIFSPGASEEFLDNKDNFTLYSLILTNKMDKYGKSNAVRLHEILRTDLFKAKTKPFRRYYDIVDLKCKMYLIDTNNATVQKILENKRYSPKEIENNEELALERLKMMENLDSITRENINKLKNSEEYKKIVEYKKSDEYKKAKTKLKELKSGPEYDKLYQEKIMPVIEMENRIQNLNEAIVSQYPDWFDFRKRVLAPAQKAFLETFRETDLMDMMFEYEPVYYRSKVIGVTFTIYTVELYKKKELEQGVQMSLFDYLKARDNEQKKSIAVMYDETGGANKDGSKPKKIKKLEKLEITVEAFDNYIKQSHEEKRIEFSAIEILKLSKLADSFTLIEKYNMMIKQDNIKNPVAWMTTAVKENWKDSSDVKLSKKGSAAANQFNQFMQTEYNFAELEKEIVSNV